jgi:hypothetical protein
MTGYIVLMAKRSERIKDKNFQRVGFKSLIDIAIDNAVKIVPKKYIFISSSYPEYKNYAKKRGAGFIDRPVELSKKEVFLADVVKHSAEWLVKNRGASEDDIIINLDICCPFTTLKQIAHCLLMIRDYDSCFSAKSFNASFIDDEPSISTGRIGRLVNFPAIRIRKIKAALSCSGWGRAKDHIDIACIPEWHIDINTQKDLDNARTIWNLRNKLK